MIKKQKQKQNKNMQSASPLTLPKGESLKAYWDFCKMGMLVHACNPMTREAEAEGL
jgi:hypothetical protein